MSTTPDNPNHPENDPWESEMSSEFERRVRDLHEAPLDLSHVKGKAMNIKRKRQAFAAGTAIAVAAAVVPIALLVGSNSSGSEGTIQPADTPSSIVDTPSEPAETATDLPSSITATSPAATVGLGFDYLTVGDGNAVLNNADGTEIELPGADYTDAADLGGTVAAYRINQDVSGDGTGPDGFVDVIEDGEVTTTYDVRGAMVITPTASAVAFVTTGSKLFVVSAKGTSPFGGVGPNDVAAALIGDGDCQLESGCHPFLNDRTTETAPYEINYEGPNTDVVPGAKELNDATDDFLASIQTDYIDGGACGGLFDRRAQDWVFETCQAQLLNISPQGDFVIGIDPQTDGIGPNYFTILDDSGKEVARYAPEGGYINRLAWADDTHAVATVFDGANWHIISVSTDGGEITELVDPVPGGDVDPAFILTGQG